MFRLSAGGRLLAALLQPRGLGGLHQQLELAAARHQAGPAHRLHAARGHGVRLPGQ